MTQDDSKMIQGLDCSHFQGKIDAAKIKDAGFSFVILKATDGLNFTDPVFKDNLKAVQDAGLIPGAYHFFRPLSDPRKQAEFFLSVVGKDPMLVACDFEWTKGLNHPQEDWDQVPLNMCSGLAESFLDDTMSALRRKPLSYGVMGFLDHYLASLAWGVYGGLWKSKLETAAPKPPYNFVIEQYSFDGQVAGVSGKVDLDRSPKSLDELRALAGYGLPD